MKNEKKYIVLISMKMVATILVLAGIGLLTACEKPATASVSPPPKQAPSCVEERYVQLSYLPNHKREYWEERANHWTSKGFVFTRKITPVVDMSHEPVWLLTRPCEDSNGR